MNDKNDNQSIDERSSETAGRELTNDERRGWVLLGFDDLPLHLSVEEASALLRVGRSTAYVWVDTGQLGSLRVGRCRRIPRDILFDFVMKHRVPPTA